MENRILARLRRSMGVEPCGADPAWLLTLLTLLPVNTYTLEEWNQALSQVFGRQICCPSYRMHGQVFTPSGFGCKIKSKRKNKEVLC